MAALCASNRFSLVAVADISPRALESVATEYAGIETFTSHQAMFAMCPTDVVCVSTWPPSHEPITMDALQLPLKGILVEKPLGHTHASGERIVEAMKRRDLPMAVPHGLVAMRASLEVVSHVRAREVGDLKLMEIQCAQWDIINAGIHWLHFFVTLTGNEPIDHVMAVCDSSTRTYRDGMQVETTAVTYAQTRSGVRVVMQTGDDVVVDPPAQGAQFRIIGTAGQIFYRPWANEYVLLNEEFPTGATIHWDQLPGTHHQRRLEEMADMIESGERDYTIPEASLMALEIVEGAYVSSRHRCKVTFPLAQFEPPTPSDWDPGRPYSGVGGGRNGRRLSGG